MSRTRFYRIKPHLKRYAWNDLTASSLEWTFHEDPFAPIHLAASVDGVDGALEGALMPMGE